MADVTDANSINSIAGVLKSFFRELQESMFPTHMFDELVNASSKYMITFNSYIMCLLLGYIN